MKFDAKWAHFCVFGAFCCLTRPQSGRDWVVNEVGWGWKLIFRKLQALSFILVKKSSKKTQKKKNGAITRGSRPNHLYVYAQTGFDPDVSKCKLWNCALGHLTRQCALGHLKRVRVKGVGSRTNTMMNKHPQILEASLQ